MSTIKTHAGKVDNSAVTPATGTNPNNKPIADSLANEMPTADFPASECSRRSDPDKIIPGPEAATSVDVSAEAVIEGKIGLKGQSCRA